LKGTFERVQRFRSAGQIFAPAKSAFPPSLAVKCTATATDGGNAETAASKFLPFSVTIKSLKM
jgi:hypothetical protein